MGGEIIGQANQVKQVGHMPKAGSHQRFGICPHVLRQEGLDHANSELRKMLPGRLEVIGGLSPAALQPQAEAAKRLRSVPVASG